MQAAKDRGHQVCHAPQSLLHWHCRTHAGWHRVHATHQGQVHRELPTAVKRASQRLHAQDAACCQVPGPGNAAEVANTSTGKETAEQMLSPACA